MQYTVVHSNDPYLLARLATDLQMEGVTLEQDFYIQHPFHESETFPQSYLHTCIDNTCAFQNHGWCPITKDEDRHELTSRNYIKVLTQILEP